MTSSRYFHVVVSIEVPQRFIVNKVNLVLRIFYLARKNAGCFMVVIPTMTISIATYLVHREDEVCTFIKCNLNYRAQAIICNSDILHKNCMSYALINTPEH